MTILTKATEALEHFRKLPDWGRRSLRHLMASIALNFSGNVH